MPNKNFLEEYPLFKKFNDKLPSYISEWSKPSINMLCGDCKSVQTFSMINEYFEFYNNFKLNFHDIVKIESTTRLLYQCQSCKIFKRQFHIFFCPSLDYYYKFGQYPEWEIKIDKNLEKMLDEHVSTFRKGLVCESQGYGIGAFSYYRRITETIIDKLLNSITDLIEDEKKEEYLNALEKVKMTRVAQEKIELVKDLLPSILKPDGANTLGVLHRELSQGLHAEMDEECLENACHIREVLTFLIRQILLSKESAKTFTASMKKILEKKSGKNSH